MRINVIGTSGVGKSTFAKKISAALGIPYLEMDKIFWKQNWVMSSDEEFFARLKHELEKPDWVLDGNYTRTVPIKWEKIDLVVWLDFSFPRILFQAVWRAARRSWTKQELWEGTGNRESFRKSFFSRESIIWWTITTHRNVRKRYATYVADPKFSHVKFVRLRTHRETDQFIEQLQKGGV